MRGSTAPIHRVNFQYNKVTIRRLEEWNEREKLILLWTQRKMIKVWEKIRKNTIKFLKRFFNLREEFKVSMSFITLLPVVTFYAVSQCQSFGCVELCDPWTVAHQVPLSMEFSRQRYRSGLPFPPPCNLPDPEIELQSPVLADGFFTIWALGSQHLWNYSTISKPGNRLIQYY